MNINNVSQREILDFDNFRKKVHDNDYKPLSPANQSEGGLEKSGVHDIKREPAYNYAGYADSVFAGQSKVDVPGVRIKIGDASGMSDASVAGTSFVSNTSESEEIPNVLKRISDF
jgi:hypothetical protein